MSCRTSKIKCNGELPACSNCTRRAVHCEYSDRDDKRKLPFRHVLGKLREHIRHLEEILVANGCQSMVPSIAPEEMDVINRTLCGIGLDALDKPAECAPGRGDVAAKVPKPDIQQSTMAVPAANLENGLQIQDYIANLDTVDWNTYLGTPDWPSMGLFAVEGDATYGSVATGMTMTDQSYASRGDQIPTIDNAPAPAMDSNISDGAAINTQSSIQDEVNPGLVGQIAARVGSLHLEPDGQLQYHGAATNAHILNTGKMRVPPPARTQSMKDEVHHLLQQVGLDTPVEEEMAHHFLGLFFSCHNVCHSIVDADVFWAARKRYRELDHGCVFYSEVLDNMMCAIGASHDSRYHSRLVTFPRTLAEFFADRAKALLDFELDTPCVSTVQALLLLSSHEAGAHRLTRSSMYSGKSLLLLMCSQCVLDVRRRHSLTLLKGWQCGQVSILGYMSLPSHISYRVS